MFGYTVIILRKQEDLGIGLRGLIVYPFYVLFGSFRDRYELDEMTI